MAETSVFEPRLEDVQHAVYIAWPITWLRLMVDMQELAGRLGSSAQNEA